MTKDEAVAIQQVVEAFRDVPPLDGLKSEPLPIDEVRRLVDDLLLLQPADLHWILPQMLIDLLRNPGQPDAESNLVDILGELNVQKQYREKDFFKLEENARRHGYNDNSREIAAHLRRRREPIYAAFTQEQAAAVLAFLKAVRDRPAAKRYVPADWAAAVEYWQRRISHVKDM